MAQSNPVPHAHSTDRIVGNAPTIQALRAQIHHLAAFDTVGSAFVPTLLLHGETGTGKGLVARVIHDSGPRAQGPFVEVNCAAIPETLLEVELFGFEAGTFTDAKRAKPGLMESAVHGTLFLDEIEALPVLLQAKLLSAIEEKRVRRLGAVASRQLDVKFIAATPTKLSLLVTEGRFRPDLYHRLAVVLLEIPPLRERGADIVVLAQHFLHRYAAAHGLPPKQVSRDAEAWLRSYGWPGNVRELSHLMERVTLFSPQVVVNATTLEQLCLPRPLRAVRSEASPIGSEDAPLDEPARIRQALDQTGGNVVQAACLLNLNRGALRYRMRQYGIGRLRWQTLTPPQGRRGRASSGLPEADRGRATSTELVTLASAWEQKPVVVLALDVTWREARERPAPPADSLDAGQALAPEARGKDPGVRWPALCSLRPRRSRPSLACRRRSSRCRNARCRQPLPSGTSWPRTGLRTADRQAQRYGWPCISARCWWMSRQATRPHGSCRWRRRCRYRCGCSGMPRPGTFCCRPRSGRLVEGWFDLHGRQGLTGTDTFDGVVAYAVVGVGPRRLPLEVYGKRPLSRFVGRERELTTLGDLLAHIDKGRGQIVGLVGEPGVGKSRLCYELTQAQRPHNWLILESSPVAYGKDTPYLPVLDLLKAYFHLDARDEQQTIPRQSHRQAPHTGDGP